MKVGIDLVMVERFKNIAENLEKSKKIFTDLEIKYINSKRGSLDDSQKLPPYLKTMAGIYAAKEAVLKALGVGIGNGIGLNEVEIDHDLMGACVVKLTKNAENEQKRLKISQILVNISHDGDYATAVCVLL